MLSLIGLAARDARAAKMEEMLRRFLMAILNPHKLKEAGIKPRYFASVIFLVLALVIFCKPALADAKQVDIFHITEDFKLEEGPLLDRRQALKRRILEAEADGIGVKNYLNAFKFVESMVVAGKQEKDLAPRLDSISRGLDEQYKRSHVLKTQKIPPPIAASSPPPSFSGESRRGGRNSGKLDSMLNGGNRNELVDKIKNGWFGGDLPDSIKKKIPPGFDPSKMSKQDIDRLMNRLGK